MPFINPKKAMCVYDFVQDVLCCACCGRCGIHAHGTCEEGSGMRSPDVATCAICRLRGVLVCKICGACGKHAHAH
jgi:hypothetical protein